MNSVVKAAKKNIKKCIQKMVITYKDWHKMLSFSLHAYLIIVRTLMGATLYSLTYGMEVVMPLEVEISSLIVLIDYKLEEVEWVKVKYK